MIIDVDIKLLNLGGRGFDWLRRCDVELLVHAEFVDDRSRIDHRRKRWRTSINGNRGIKHVGVAIGTGCCNDVRNSRGRDDESGALVRSDTSPFYARGVFAAASDPTPSSAGDGS